MLDVFKQGAPVTKHVGLIHAMTIGPSITWVSDKVQVRWTGPYTFSVQAARDRRQAVLLGVRPSGGAPLGAVEADCELSIGAVGGRRILCRRS